MIECVGPLHHGSPPFCCLAPRADSTICASVHRRDQFAKPDLGGASLLLAGRSALSAPFCDKTTGWKPS